jgi:nucleotide-binding universal stress UspA family protein
MLSRILVPLDGSELAERALTYATALARPTGAQLVLVRAVVSHTLAGVDPRERQMGAIREAEAYLEQIATNVRLLGFGCEPVVRYGHAAECIVESTRTRHVDLIVIASHGRTGPSRLVFGSVAEAVVAASPVPVLVQRAWQPLFGKPLLDDNPQLIVPLDGSVFAESALEPAAKLAHDLAGRLLLVSVATEPATVPSALEYLTQIKARVTELHPELSVDSDLRVGDAAFGIEEAVALYEASLVVMATHGRGGVLRSMLGSVAGKVMQHGEVPVVLIRPVRVELDESAPAGLTTARR